VANRRHRSSRGSKQRGLNTWTTILGEDVTLTAGGSVSFGIVEDSDWVPAAGTARATLMRIRGWHAFLSKDNSGSFAGGSIFAYIGIFDEDTASPAASLVSTYVDEDVLWTGGTQFPFQDIGQSAVWHEHVDVKAQRKLTTGLDVRIVITNTMSVDLELTFLYRALLKRGAS